jgi:hypothetical protein
MSELEARVDWPSLEQVTDEKSLNDTILAHQDVLNARLYFDEPRRLDDIHAVALRLEEAAAAVYAGQRIVCIGELHLPTLVDGKVVTDIRNDVEARGPLAAINWEVTTSTLEGEGGLTSVFTRVRLGYSVDTRTHTLSHDKFGPTTRPWWIFVPAETAVCYTENNYTYARIENALACFDSGDELIVAITAVIEEDPVDLGRLNTVFNRIRQEARIWGHSPEDYLVYLHALTSWERRRLELDIDGKVTVSKSPAVEALDVTDGLVINTETTKLEGVYSGTFWEFTLTKDAGGAEVLSLMVSLHQNSDTPLHASVPAASIRIIRVNE